MKKQTFSPEVMAEKRTETGKLVVRAEGHYSEIYPIYEDELKIISGHMWDPEVRKNRGDRPTLTVNYYRAFLNRILNPMRMNNFGIKISHDDPDKEDFMRGVVNDIEYYSRADEVYEVAAESQISCGFGAMCVALDYSDNSSMDLKVFIKQVNDSTMVKLEPSTNMIDGSDASWGYFKEYINRDDAIAEFGEEVANGSSAFETDEMTQMEDDSLSIIYFYKIVESKKKKYFFKDQDPFEVEENEELAEDIEFEDYRTVSDKHVICQRWVGGLLVNETKLPIDYIPIVPVYGERYVSEDGKLMYGGIVRPSKDSALMANYYVSSEAELASQAPRQPYILDPQQIEPYKDIWDNINGENHAYLPYDTIVKHGVALEKPQRADNTAQTNHLIASAQNAFDNMARAIGMHDPNFGIEQHAGQSGIAQALKGSTGEIATAHYMDNMGKSIVQMGKIVVQLICRSYDTNRTITVRLQDGKTKKIPDLNIKDLNLDPEEFEVSTDAGPAYENRRKESAMLLMHFGEKLPAAMPYIAPSIMEKLGEDDNAAILRKAFQVPEIGDEDEEIPEQAREALEQYKVTVDELQQTIDSAEGYIVQLQTSLIDNEKDRDTDITLQEMKGIADISKERLKQAGENYRANLKANTEMKKVNEDNDTTLTQEIMKGEVQNGKNITELEKTAIGAVQKTAEAGRQQTIPLKDAKAPGEFFPVVGGPVVPNTSNNEDIEIETE
jgi:hypothetical protein